MTDLNEMTIRRLQPGDEETVKYILREIKSETSPLPEPEEVTVDNTTSFLLMDDVYLLVAEKEGKAIGFLLSYRLPRIDRSCEMVCIYEMEVHQHYRRQGVGTKLVRAMLNICREGQIMKMWVITDASNRGVAALFAGTGFSPKEGREVLEFTWFRQACDEEEKEPWAPDL